MKKIYVLVSLIVIFALLFSGCGGKSKTASDSKTDFEASAKVDSSTSEAADSTASDTEAAASESTADTLDQPKTDAPTANKAAMDASGFIIISDFADYWSNMYKTNEKAINDYQGMPIMELVYAGSCFIIGVQYDLLNLTNSDGHFEGELMLAGYKGYVDKNGPQYTFGYEEVLEEDGLGGISKAGDKKAETGNCDLKKGYYYSEDYTEREGIKLSRSVNEIQIEKDGSISTITQEGKTTNFMNEEEPSTEIYFVRNGNNQFDFAIAKSTSGPEFDAVKLENDMTKEKAIALFEAAGYTLEMSGGIVNGVITLD